MRPQTRQHFLLPCLLLLLLGCSDNSDSPAAGAITSGSFSALAYNVAGLPEALSGSSPATNMPIISPLLNNYDIVLVQEDWETPTPNGLAPLRVYHEILAADALHPYQSDPAPLPLGSDPSRPSALVSDGLNRFSQFPFSDVVRTPWQGCDNNSGDCLALKGFSLARTLVAEGVCIDIYNVHGEAGNREGDRVLKTQNTRDLAAFIEANSHGRAVIIGGDFNQRLSRSHDAENLAYLKAQTGLTNACEALGIIDEEAIDKFFFRSGGGIELSPTRCQFELDIFVTPEGGPLSDHDALATEFTWSATPNPGASCL